jgi:acyl-CoA thioesterase-1
VSSDPLRYVALGDSYTIGTSVREGERWPDQLVATLGEDVLELAANLAVNGSTSEDVLEFELPALDKLRPAFLSLLVGVNDVVQGVPAERYHRNLREIFEALLGHVGATRILVVTTPDYTATPRGGDFGDRAQQRAGVLRNNGIITETAREWRITVVDIFDISERAEHDRALVASDGLHPSGRQYSLWVERILPVVASRLGRSH